MTLIPLKSLKPNPWRDLTSCPIDENQVTALVNSINQHGFFGGIKARPNGNGYQIGFGHSRIEAAKRIRSLREVDIHVEDMDDDTMINLMCVENATQQGSKSAAVLNEVEAVTKRLAVILHGNASLSRICERLPRSLFASEQAFTVAKKTMLNGVGIGEKLILRYLGHGDESACPRSQTQIKEALVTLKQSGLYDRIMQEIGITADAEVEAEVEDEAGQDEATPRQRRTTPTISRRQSHPRIFDERCLALFNTESQSNAFRSAVTTSSAQRFITVEQQLPLAKKLLRELRAVSTDSDDVRGTGRRGASFVKTFVADRVREAIEQQRHIDAEERQRLMLDQRRSEMITRADYLLMHIRSVAGGFVKLAETLRQQPELWHDTKINRIVDKVDSLQNGLKQFKQQAQQARR